jgi:hypothetical protein
VPSLVVLSLSMFGCEPEETEGGPVAPSEGPVYMAATRVWDDVSTTSYFHLVDSIASDTVVESSQALEVPGAAKLYALEGIGWFAIGEGESPTITRYTLDEDGRLAADASMSFLDYGVQSLWDQLYVVSATKAYYPDPDLSQLVVWNPTEMTVTGSIPLPETARDGFVSYYGLTPLLRGTDLVFTVSWFDWNVNDEILGETGLVVLDTTTDTVKSFTADDRCGGIVQGIELDSGETYFVSSALAAATHVFGRIPTEPCALRIEEGATAFDPSYSLALADVTGGMPAGEPVPNGDGGFFLRVLDLDAAKVKKGGWSWSLTGQTLWAWWSFDPATQTATRDDAIPAATADAFWFEIDGGVYASQTNSDYTETKLVEVTNANGPTDAITLPGFLQGIARIR